MLAWRRAASWVAAAVAAAPARRFGWLLTRGALFSLLLIVGMVGVVWVSIWLHLAEQKQQFRQHALSEAANLAQTAAAGIHQTLASVDDALRLAASVYASDPKHFDIAAVASRVNRTHSTGFEVALIGPDGKLADSSLGTPVTPIDLSGERFFQVQRDDDADRMFVSEPILGRTTARWSLLFTRRVQGADGWFMGVVAAAVSPDWLTGIFNALDIGRGTLLLLDQANRIRSVADANASVVKDGIGRSIGGSPLALAAAGAARGALAWRNPLTGATQLIAFAKIPDYDSIVAVGLDEGESLAAYRTYARQYEIFGACLTALILAAGVLLLDNTRRILMSRSILQNTMNAISQGVVMIDADGRIPVINRRTHELLQLPAEDSQASALLRAEASSGKPPADDSAAARLLAAHGMDDVQPRAEGTAESVEQSFPNGTVLEIRTHRLDDGGLVRTYTDITERKQTEAKIIHLALHDALTGLPNRIVFADRLSAELRRTAGEARACAVLWINLDRFKHINNLRGQGFGDCVLLQVAERLHALVQPDDLLARFGGDEFCILRTGVHDPDAVERLARQVLARLAEPYEIDGRFTRLTASIGGAISKPHAVTSDELLTQADTALFRAKGMGRGIACLFDPQMDAKITEQRLLEDDLRTALAQDALRVHYQPTYNVITGRISGFEALARWPHPSRGAVPPAIFVQVAEEAGLVGALGEWVMRTACADARRWPGGLHLAVNVSPKQIWEPDITRRTARILEEAGLQAERLTLEITESVLMDASDERALSAIGGLKDLGAHIALDDFGTGFSSLSYLHRFPFDRLKIDKSFVHDLLLPGGSQTIVQAIISLSRNLRLGVVAEGVERQGQLDWLRAAGCPEVQGFLIGRPMPADNIPRFLAQCDEAIAEPSFS
jgi:diguanylate cyclase (GGDEF)-like protein